MEFKLNIELFAKAGLGEGPLWDYRDNTLYYIDIEGRYIKHCDVDTGRETVLPLPQKVGAIALCKDGRILAAMEDGIYYIGEDGHCTMAHDPISVPGSRFNDGKVGPDGRFYVGTMSRERKGAFYRLDPDGQLTMLFDGVGTSNGLDWTADHRMMYYADTPTQRIDAFDFDIEHGTLSNRRPVILLEGKERPDGLCLNEHGILHIALWGSRKVIIMDPASGERLGEIPTPALQTSCPAFGGKDLSTLYITSASIGRLDDPAEQCAGRMFSIQMPYKGNHVHLFG